ncbi:MAG: BON domain-containing protein [Chitinophagaceae bacterium]|nr:BON domain-containing protein [Anaerolineae bacterium]
MHTNVSDDHLRVEVVRAILCERPALRRDVIVIALSGGLVILRGLVPTAEDCHDLEQIIKRVPNVNQVFCHVAIRVKKTHTQAVAHV